jgi:hypothetical protein
MCPGSPLRYIPHLDYDLQRYGPESPEGRRALDFLTGYLTRLRNACTNAGWDWIFVGDYAIESVTHGAVFPNHALREAGPVLHARDRRHGLHRLFTSAGVRRGRSPSGERALQGLCRPRQGGRRAREAFPVSARSSVARRRSSAALPGGIPVNCSSWPNLAPGLPIRGLRRTARRITRATWISTTSPATTRASSSSGGLR